MKNNKSLGQHWLKDPQVLEEIADLAKLTADDTVLEIGPGLGTLTSRLLRKANKVIAVEFDEALAAKLPGQFPGKNLDVIHQDILQFDLNKLPQGYKVVANVPYYITSKIIEKLSEAENPPSLMILLVQKEVAERLAAGPGSYSILALAAQIDHQVSLGPVVTRDLFTPPPKVDSQVVIMRRLDKSLVESSNRKKFFRLIKAGFVAKRKKLRSSLAGSLHLSKEEVEQMLRQANISADDRAEALSIEQWLDLIPLVDSLE